MNVHQRDYKELGALMKHEMETTYAEFPLTFLFERQLSGVFLTRFRRVMQRMVKEWMHGYYVEALKRWRDHCDGHSKQEQEVASVIIQRVRRGYLGRVRATSMIERRNVREERTRFKAMMKTRSQWLSAIIIQKIARGMRDRTGEPLRFARHRMKCIIKIQSGYRIKNSKFLFLVLGAKRKLENIAAAKIQRIALGFGGRRRAKHRKKVKTMEERERLLGDRSYVMAQGFRREGACVLLQRWSRFMHGGWRNPKFVGHQLMVRPQSLWRGHCDRTGDVLKGLQFLRWKKMLGEKREKFEPPASVLTSWWRGRHRRLLFKLMMKAAKDHIEELRRKKEEAFKEVVVSAPGILGKMGMKINQTAMRRRSKSLSRSMSFGWRGKKKHSAVMLQNWWRLMSAQKVVRKKKREEVVKRNAHKVVAAVEIQRIGRGCMAKRRVRKMHMLRAVLFCQRHWRGRGLRFMTMMMKKYTRQVVLMQK